MNAEGGRTGPGGTQDGPSPADGSRRPVPAAPEPATTVDYGRRDDPAPAVPSVVHQPVPAVAATEAPSVADRLRRSRLRAAALFLAIIPLVAIAWDLLRGASPPWPLGVTAAIQAGAFAWLSGRRDLTGPRLRILEFIVFGLMTGSLAILQYRQMLSAVERWDALDLMARVKNALMGSMILMFAYAMLIPNARRTAAAAVLFMAAVPVATEGLLFHRHPEALQFARESRVLFLSGVNALLMAIAAGLAIFGTHVLISLRQEVFEARRLNQYQLAGPIGRGGMGEVHLAEHRLLKRTCAIKLIRPGGDRDPVALEWFEREVRATARLAHPNIVEVYDYGQTEDGTFYYVMEYLDGLDLGEMVRRHGPLPAGRVIYLLAQACEGLAEAHAAGLIHRDLKPTNIFAARVGRRSDVAKVLDFGLVKDMRPGEAGRARSEGVLGTLSFMAPEQMAADPALDHRADLFALGAVASYLLTGRLPLADEGGFRPVDHPTSDRVVPPSTHRPGVPADLERVILRCLAEDPAARYPDAGCVRDALASCASAGEWDPGKAMGWWREIETPCEPGTPRPDAASSIGVAAIAGPPTRRRAPARIAAGVLTRPASGRITGSCNGPHRGARSTCQVVDRGRNEMNARLRNALLCGLAGFLATGPATESRGCTEFRVKAADGTVVIGRTMDFGTPTLSRLRSYPRGERWAGKAPGASRGSNGPRSTASSPSTWAGAWPRPSASTTTSPTG